MKIRHEFLTMSLTTFVAWLVLASISSASDRPNIILMMADDMGLGDTSAYQDFTGNSDADQIATPNMQRLASMGVRFTDAHAPSSRCSPTRYGLLTGRYPWRNRLKHFVLFGVQGDPMIEADRPTLGTLMKSHGYRTGLFGKWHVGLRYRQSDGRPAAGWDDADLAQPMADTPLDHGFDVCHFTSRSHGTSGTALGTKQRPNDEHQSHGPGHIDGRTVVSATGRGKQLHSDGPNAYVLDELGGRHSDHVIEFISEHVRDGDADSTPFFVYYPSNSNHSPYTPDEEIGGVAVAGASRSVRGEPMNARSDFIHENDVALGRMIDFLEQNEAPRRPGHPLIDNTIVIFTSDNGAESKSKTATGPFRSNKGSCYEGGHRVPLLVAWKNGGVGDGDPQTAGQTNTSLVGLHDMFATFVEILGSELPDLRRGEKGAEDSRSVLAAWRGNSLEPRPMFYHDHKQAKPDPAASALRLDNPTVAGQEKRGQWKIFFDAALLRAGQTNPVELYDLATDPMEAHNLIQEPALQPLVAQLCDAARLHRNCGGHRYSDIALSNTVAIDFQFDEAIRDQIKNTQSAVFNLNVGEIGAEFVGQYGDSAEAKPGFDVSDNGIGMVGGTSAAVDSGETMTIRFDRDVLVESVSLFAGGQPCGGFYKIGDNAPLNIYCVDADIDSQDQSGVLSDIGVVRKGQPLTLSSEPFLGVETPGSWRIRRIQLRELAPHSIRYNTP